MTTTCTLIGPDLQLKVPGGQSGPWRTPAPPPGQNAQCLSSPRDSADLDIEIRELKNFHCIFAKLAKDKQKDT